MSQRTDYQGRPLAALWWERPPWRGVIADRDFRAIVEAYITAHGSYSPDLPVREPGVLKEWLRAHHPDLGLPEQAPRLF